MNLDELKESARWIAEDMAEFGPYSRGFDLPSNLSSSLGLGGEVFSEMGSHEFKSAQNYGAAAVLVYLFGPEIFGGDQ